MQANELLPQQLVHSLDSGGMSPITIMDCCEDNVFLAALLCRVHHVRRVEAVHKVGREG